MELDFVQKNANVCIWLYQIKTCFAVFREWAKSGLSLFLIHSWFMKKKKYIGISADFTYMKSRPVHISHNLLERCDPCVRKLRSTPFTLLTKTLMFHLEFLIPCETCGPPEGAGVAVGVAVAGAHRLEHLGAVLASWERSVWFVRFVTDRGHRKNCICIFPATFIIIITDNVRER